MGVRGLAVAWELGAGSGGRKGKKSGRKGAWGESAKEDECRPLPPLLGGRLERRALQPFANALLGAAQPATHDTRMTHTYRVGS